MSARKYLRCPECGKKGVYASFGRSVQRHGDAANEDAWVCRYCEFSAYTGSGSILDSGPCWALSRVNPGIEVAGAPDEKPTWPSYLRAPEPWLAKWVALDPKEQ